MSVPEYIIERANSAKSYDSVYNFDCQILDYIRWQDKAIEDMRENIHELEQKLDILKNDVERLRRK
jgi:hypothetical protein